MKTALDNVKDLEIEVKQWQGRLDHAKSENTRLVRENEELKKDADSVRSAVLQSNERERATTRQEMNKLTEAKMKLDQQRSELIEELNQFKVKKTAFEQERQVALDTKANYEAMMQKAGVFILLVKREAEKL